MTDVQIKICVVVFICVMLFRLTLDVASQEGRDG